MISAKFANLFFHNTSNHGAFEMVKKRHKPAPKRDRNGLLPMTATVLPEWTNDLPVFDTTGLHELNPADYTEIEAVYLDSIPKPKKETK